MNAKIPIITYIDDVILQNDTYEILTKNTFYQEEKEEILNTLLYHNIYPIVCAYILEKEKFSYLSGKCNRATTEFIATHKGDAIENPDKFEKEL